MTPGPAAFRARHGRVRASRPGLPGVGDRGYAPTMRDRDRLVHGGRDVLVMVDELDDLTHDAHQVPLTDQVRVDPKRFRALTADMRSAMAVIIDDEARVSNRPMTRWIEALERIIDEAPKMPIGPKVRLNRERVFEALDGFRMDLPDAVRRRRQRE